MPPVRLLRFAVVVLTADEQLPVPGEDSLWYQLPVCPLMVSVALVSFTALAASPTAAVVKSTSAILSVELQPVAL